MGIFLVFVFIAAMTCHQCLKAMQVAQHGSYVDGCLGCQIRKLVHAEQSKREAMLDRIQFAHGHGARVEAVRLIEIERARIKRLRGLEC